MDKNQPESSVPRLTGGPFGFWDRPEPYATFPDEMSWRMVADRLRKADETEYGYDRESHLSMAQLHIDAIVEAAMANLDQELELLLG